jgi:hypothetical protein
VWHTPDPFWTQGGFPWVVLVPLAVGVQHGLLPALASTVLLGLGAQLHASALNVANLAASSSGAALSTWTGCWVVAALAGGFKQHAVRAERAEHERAEELKRRLQRSLRQQRVVALSHRRLEERLAADAWSLAGVVSLARRELEQASTAVRAYQVLLDVLASQAQIQVAAFFACRDPHAAPAHAELEPAALCALGRVAAEPAGAPAPQQAVVLRALRTGSVALLAPEGHSGGAGSVLAAVPLWTSDGRLLGIVAVYEMSFISFRRETFMELDTIAHALADAVAARLAELGQLPGSAGAAALIFARAVPARSAALAARAGEPACEPADDPETAAALRKHDSSVRLRLGAASVAPAPVARVARRRS